MLAFAVLCTVEHRLNEPQNNEGPDITNHIYPPGNSKMYEKALRYNKHNLPVPGYFTTSGYHCNILDL